MSLRRSVDAVSADAVGSDAGSTAAPHPALRRPLRVGLQVVVAGALVVAMFAAARSLMERSGDHPSPTASRWLVALVLVLAAVQCGARGWSAFVAGDGRDAALRRGYALSQLGKYVPGGIWQFAGQAVSAARHGFGRARAAGLVALFTGQFAAAAALFAPFAAVGLDTSWWVRAALIGCAAAGVFCSFPATRAAVAWATRHRLTRRAGSTLELPDRRAWNRSAVLLLLHHAMQGAALAIVLGGGRQSAFAVAVAYPIAWLAGLLAVPVPSGIGVREAVLAGLLAPTGLAAVMGAAIAHRLLNLVAEAVWSLAEHLRANAAKRRRDSAIS